MEPSNKQGQSINHVELMMIKAKVQILYNIEHSLNLLNTSEVHQYARPLFRVIMRSIDQINNQEMDDLDLETSKLNRIVQLSRCKNSYPYVIKKFLAYHTKLTIQESDEKLKGAANNSYYSSLAKAQKRKTVRPIGLSKGNWYKCPNGHVYSVGESESASQTGKCFCPTSTGRHPLQYHQVNEMGGARKRAAR